MKHSIKKIKATAKLMRDYNRWRRGEDFPYFVQARDVGIAIDVLCDFAEDHTAIHTKSKSRAKVNPKRK